MAHRSEGTEASGQAEPAGPPRRSFLAAASTAAMAGGLVASYGTFAAYAGRFLYPARGARKGWMFVAEVGRMNRGDAVIYSTPGGAPVTIARQDESGSVEDFVALSSTCPHLGCRVHWEPQNDRFFCPCHSGVFDPTGRATEGPPADAGQSLSKFPLKIEKGLLYIKVQLESIAAAGPRPEA